MTHEDHLLVFFPHLDDEAFSSAGTIIEQAENRGPVTYACLTLGEMGRNMGRPVLTNRE
jgi:LmbE family N-acetylglucosaminyl deacetylase